VIRARVLIIMLNTESNNTESNNTESNNTESNNNKV